MHQNISIMVLQLAVIIIVAKLFGYLCQRYINLPRVLGELLAGIIIGPYLLGSIGLPFLGGDPLFLIAEGELIPNAINNIAVLASIILLFMAGLETNVAQFLRFSGIASLIAIGGFVTSFLAGSLIPVLLVPSITSITHPSALILGTLATATSVGMTARILTDLQQMSSPEAASILAAAVLDDVLGILLLTIIVGIIRSKTGVQMAWSQIGIIALKAFGFWLASSIVSIIIAPYLARSLKAVHSLETITGIILGLAFVMAFFSELSGLALIIGGYITGLAMSRTDIANEIRERLHGTYQFFVPIFFASMGMMINIQTITPQNILLGTVFAVGVIIAKIAGCGALSLLTGFRLRGALRIGIGMIPRGEVTLIIAGTGLAIGAINQELFSIAVITLLFSSILAPPLLQSIFKGRSSFKMATDIDDQQCITLPLPSVAVANFLAERILSTFRSEEYYVNSIKQRVYQIRKETELIILEKRDQDICIFSTKENTDLIRLLLAESMIELQDMFKDLQNFDSTSQSTPRDFMRNIFQ